MMENASIEIDQYRLIIKGNLTFNTVNRIWEKSLSLLEHLPHVEIDLSQVNESDSSALALFIGWYRLAKKKEQTLSFQHVPEQLFNIAKISRVDEILPFNH